MTGPISLRIACADDAGAIKTLTREAYAKWVEVIGREPLPMTADYDEAVRKHRFDLFHMGDRLVALIETVPDDDCLLIENVAVLPEFQRQGLGKRLLALAEERARASGLAGMCLYTNKRFTGPLALYEALGYRVEREELGGGGVKVHMIKSLAEI
jgi:ribosomal protein S18 acetylase RimI-like enzyme